LAKHLIARAGGVVNRIDDVYRSEAIALTNDMNRIVMTLVVGCALMTVAGRDTECSAKPRTQSVSPVAEARQKDDPSSSNSKPISDSEPVKNSDATPAQTSDNANSLRPQSLARFLEDQKAIWTSPAQLRLADAGWLVPLGLFTAGTLATDTEFSKHLSNSPSWIRRSGDFSNYGLGAMGGLAAGLYLWGQRNHDDHKSETGLLAGEAAFNSLAVVYALKYSFPRERPLQNDFQGAFWKGGDSFPSEHAAAAWSIASVVAHEYPGPLTEILAYGMASAVSVSRLTAKQHFPSDVLIGSAVGWLSGEVTYRRHHDPELAGSTWNRFSESLDYLTENRPRQRMGTTFVPLDSWVYPAFDRLAGLGYIHTAVAGLRPWTRMECARLIEEASEGLEADESANRAASALLERLRLEFSAEAGLLDGGRNTAANLESVYVRAVSISGPALTDGFHFGQTVSYDFGRPFERGTNGQAGAAFRTAMGPIAIYIRTEYQHAPEAPAPSDAVRGIIALRDLVPEPPAVAVAAVNRPRLLDAYVAVNLGNWQILIGKQSLEWGPGPGGSMLWSDNAEPVDMVRLVNSEPTRLPGLLKYLGPARVDQFIGRLGGDTFIRRPFIYGNKINFKPLPNLEFGYGRTVTIGGVGGEANPLTPGNFFDSFFGLHSNGILGGSVPGDSHANLDWTFNVPKVRNYIVLYGDWYTDDDAIGITVPARSAYRPGIYITHFPGAPKLDLHIEAANTESPLVFPNGTGNTGDLNYWNFVYRDGYTNNGNLIGNVVGRMGQAYQGWLSYWLSPRNILQLIYKNSSVASAFIPGGGAWQDYSVRNETYWKSGFYLKTQLQYEHISHYPILFSGAQQNFTAIVEAGFSPGSGLRGASK
jgi:membrane-associated phospholipid phosphatase